jgi:uncharacterized membrane protein YbaN (DUF454 family)
MKNILIVMLVLLAVVMIILGINAAIIPPILTGVGFLVIAALFYTKK